MNFQGLGRILKGQTYLDQAFAYGRGQTRKNRPSIKLGRKNSKEDKSKKLEAERIKLIMKFLCGQFNAIHEKYPKFSQFDPFYKELSDATLNLDALRLSLGSVKWAEERIKYLGNYYRRRVLNTAHEHVNKIRNQFLGRVSSIVRQIDDKLAILEEGRKILKRFPAIKTGMPTVVLVGFPNVGKSALLAALTGATPEINSYPFTTKTLLMGYIKEEGKSKRKLVQVIDSPGLLDRPHSQRNHIEQQAVLALKHIATAILFVFDISESCGYTLKDQIKLFDDMKKTFSLPTTIIVNKTDLVKDVTVSAFTQHYVSASYTVFSTVAVDLATVSAVREHLVSSYGSLAQAEELQEE